MPAAAEPAAASRVPNLVVVGVAKAGTTSLFHYLGQHRDICSSDVKELRYFSPLQYGEPLAPLTEYAAHFRHCRQQRYATEVTPGYFYGGRPIAQGLRHVSPSMRTLVVLRSPEDRCWSFYRFVKSKVRIPQDMTFSAYLDRCEELHRSGSDLDRDQGEFSGLIKGCYTRWLDDWTDEFGDQFKIVFFEDLAADPNRCLKSICAWLEIEQELVDDFDFNVDNKTIQYRHPRIQKTALRLSRRTARVLERHQKVKRLVRASYYSMNRAGAEEGISAADHERMTNFYRSYNARLVDQLGPLGLTLPPNWTAPRGRGG